MRFNILIIVSFLFHTSFAQEQIGLQELKAGDFLFQDLGGGDLSNAIKKVTPHYDGHYFSHVGMLTSYNDKLVVMEAYDNITDTVSVKTFIARSKETIYVGRLDSKFQAEINNASEAIKKYRGIKYDEKYLPDSNQMYCAELIYFVFKEVNQHQDFFKMQPMTFKDPETLKLFPGWINYYQKYFQMDVPEGQLGINPGLLINDKRLTVYRLK
jgi:hypothetical protein